MDGDFDRSIRLLDEAVSSQGRKLFRRSFKTRDFENTVFLGSEYEDRNLEAMQSHVQDMTSMFEITKMNYTASVADSSKPSADNLYMEFFEILQTHTQSSELLNAVAEMSRCCADTLGIIQEANAKLISKPVNEAWLENERNTWRLLYILYSDRLNQPTIEEDDQNMSSYFGHSEKYCMLSLFKRNHLIRECQLVVDWLECNAAQKDAHLHFSDSSMGWENTLHQLKSKDTIVFETAHKIVNSMDPDAQHYQKLPLHDIDMEDEKKLCYKVFHQIRCGKLEEAQKLCAQSGHYWRSALLEGWKLYHNPNLDDQFSKEYDEGFAEDMPMDETSPGDKPVEGNEIRDIWKKTAWNYSNNPTIDTYEKAAVGAFCGNLKSLINVCKTWEDYLWTHMRVMIDIKVESELRENVTKNYQQLPKSYWEQKMSINEIFAALEASKTKNIQLEAISFDHIIQKFIILDEITNLVDAIADWILDPNISTQFLRFLTHLLLFLEQIDQVNNREIAEKVIEEYLKRLIQEKQTQLVAFYVSKLNETTQIHMFSTYLESIVETASRREALQYAEDCGLNVSAITKQVVENIRGRGTTNETNSNVIDESIEFKINSLDWLLFYPKQLPELVHQANALICQFLITDKHDAAQLAFNKVPDDAIAILTQAENSTPELQQIAREHLSYKAYFDAQEAFTVWFRNFRNKPQPPGPPECGALYAKQVEYEHKVSQFTAETGRWKITMEQLAKQAKQPLYNMLLFPDGGWLHGAKEATHLQTKYIPQCLLLLFNVLYDSEQFEECVQLADILASEKYQVYKHFSNEKIAEALKKIAEASVALLNHGKDPWGNETRA